MVLSYFLVTCMVLLSIASFLAFTVYYFRFMGGACRLWATTSALCSRDMQPQISQPLVPL